MYAEPSVVDAAAWEFADTEQMMEAAERLYGPYRWDRYDLLVLPPSFPYGGMENPRLTFVTPTILAGDRSLVTLIAHELAHSWSGNLVTNATWDDFWLNEGFTVYFETRIDEELYGADVHRDAAAPRPSGARGGAPARRPSATPGWSWTWPVATRGRSDARSPTRRAHSCSGCSSRRSAASGSTRSWRPTSTGSPSSRWTPPTFARLPARGAAGARLGVTDDDVQLEAWVHGPGLPDNAPDFPSDAFDRVDQQVAALLAGQAADSLDTAGWASHQWVHFVRALPAATSRRPSWPTVDAAFGLSRSGNIEVSDRLAGAGDRSPATCSRTPAVDQALAEFLTRHGRALAPEARLRRSFAATPQGLDARRGRSTQGAADVPLGVTGRHRPDPGVDLTILLP